MLRNRNYLAEDYFDGRFRYDEFISGFISPDRFEAVRQQFSKKYDDFYHPYFKKYGDQVSANKALIRLAFQIFSDTYGHLPRAYKNCAISSGTDAHHEAVIRNYHTTDRLSRVVGGDRHGQIIKNNSQRSLERIERIKDLFPEVFFIAPTMFEGSTRVFSNGFGRELTSIPFQAEEYMAFWNMVIDSCEAFALDDLHLDMPSIEELEMEIDLARRDVPLSPERKRIRTSDWNNSRNSLYEAMRGNYIRFGMHPLRPDARMDMRLYDEATDRLYPARHVDIMKAVLQNVLRWSPQGIATDSACISAMGCFDLHRLRTDSVYNGFQEAPFDPERISPLVAKPTLAERKEADGLIDRIEPFIMDYLPFLIKTDGYPVDYALAQKKHVIQPSDIGQKSMEWQRRNIPKNLILDLWELTLPTTPDLKKACKVKPISHGVYVPQRRLHDFENQPFTPQEGEIWPDRPFDKLDPMFQQLAKAHIGTLEIVAQNKDAPEFAGFYHDLKRGEAALDEAGAGGVADIALLPGVLGKNFKDKVRDPNLALASAEMDKARISKIGKDEKKIPAFGTPIIAGISAAITSERPHFNGPGPQATPSDYRLGLYMEMLRRNLTSHKTRKNWETSEDEVRIVMQATKMEFGRIERPAGNNTEIKLLDEKGEYLSFADRIGKIHTYLSILKEDPNIKRCLDTRGSEGLEGYGVRHISLSLARMMEIYDCLNDQDYNNFRFELRRVENQRGFSKDMETIAQYRGAIIESIQKDCCWLWAEEDLKDLPVDYRFKWQEAHGRQASMAGPSPSWDTGIRTGFVPR